MVFRPFFAEGLTFSWKSLLEIIEALYNKYRQLHNTTKCDCYIHNETLYNSLLRQVTFKTLVNSGLSRGVTWSSHE